MTCLSRGAWIAVLALLASPVRAEVLSGSRPDANDADLVLWLAADSLALEDGAPLKVWPDRSAQQHDLVGGAGGGGFPRFARNRLNGLPGVRFDGTHQSLVGRHDLDLGQEHTILVVAEGHGGFVSYASTARGDAIQASELDLGFDPSRGLRSVYPGIDAAQGSAKDEPAVFAQVRAPPNVRGYVGDSTSPVLNVSARSRAISTIGKTLRVGAFGRTGGYLDGAVFEVLVYRRALSALELAEVFAYLKDKWLPNEVPLARVVSAASTWDAWYRDRGTSGFDLIDGALDFYHRGAGPLPALEFDGGARGLAFALRSDGAAALQLSLSAIDRAGVKTPIVSAAASGVNLAGSTHIAALFSTSRADGRVNARLFAAPEDVPIDTTSRQFELASATSSSALDAAASDALNHAFNAARVTDELPGLRVWRGVPELIRSPERFPDFADRVHPEPEPSLPAQFDPFEPPVSATAPARGAPAIAEWTRSATASDALVLSGERLSAQSGKAEGEDAAFTVFGQSAESLAIDAASILRLRGRRAAIRLGPALPRSSLYLIWPQNKFGYGRPVAVNRSEAWWLGPNRATRRQTVSVFGRNLAHAAGTSSAFVYLKPQGRAAGQWLAPSAVNPYKVDFVVPSDLPNGAYEVWAHNGQGGRYGWSRPVALTVDDGIEWNGSTFDVAVGGGDAAIQAAVDAAAASARASGLNATVRFPAGTFSVTRTIELPSKVRLVGAGKDATFLRGKGAFGGRGHLLWINGVQINELADLTLDFADATSRPDAYLLSGSSQDLRVQNVRFVALGDNQFVIYHSPQRGSFSGCDFIGPMVLLIDSSQVAFDRCRFFGTRDSVLLYLSAGVRELSVTRCSGQDYDIAQRSLPDGWSQGRFVNIVNRTRLSRDIYIADNVTRELGVNPNFSNSNTGEQISWDEAQGQFIGMPLAAANDAPSDSATLQFAKPPPAVDADHSLIAVVLAGTGEGQTRDVLAVEGKRVRVSPSFSVLPDKTSRVVLGSFHERAVVYRNHLDGKAEQVLPEAHIGAAGIEPYGGMSNFIADANSVTDCRYGLYVMGIASDIPAQPIAILPSLFHLYTGNLVQGSRNGLLLGTGGNVAGEMAAFGYMFRGNTFLDPLAAVGFIVQDARTDNLDMAVFDRTLGFDTPIGFSFIGPGASPVDVGSVLLLNNHFERGSARAADSSAISAALTNAEAAPASHIWSQNNTWLNFARAYTGSPAAPAPDLPVRRLFAYARKGSGPVTLRFSVFNNATRDARYGMHIARDAAWLSASEPPPMIRAHASAIYELIADPRELAVGLHRASVEIGDGRETSLSVLFRVLP